MSLLSDIAHYNKTFTLFISHAWQYGEEYERLVQLLNSDRLFRWNNLSVPESNPLPKFGSPKSDYHLVKRLCELVSKANCMLIIAGMYGAHSRYMQTEIDAAKDLNVPIVAVKPWRQERMPEAVTLAANETVGWLTSAIVSVVRRVCSPPPKNVLSMALEQFARTQAISKSTLLTSSDETKTSLAAAIQQITRAQGTPKPELPRKDLRAEIIEQFLSAQKAAGTFLTPPSNTPNTGLEALLNEMKRNGLFKS